MAKFDKYYGVIDLQENTIVPIKYKSFKKVGVNLYLTNLNGYYGILDHNNTILVKNDYDKIEPLFDTFLLKKQWKYGLLDINAKLILEPIYDSIKSLGEYIIVKNNGLYSVLDSSGKQLSSSKYKSIKLKRNVLYAKTIENKWISLIENN